MSRFEFHTQQIDQALYIMSQIRGELLRTMADMMREAQRLGSQKSLAVQKSSEALVMTKGRIWEQYCWVAQLEKTLKAVRQDVRIAELKAAGTQLDIGDFMQMASAVFAVGWGKETGKAMGLLLNSTQVSGGLFKMRGESGASWNWGRIKDGERNNIIGAEAKASGSFALAEGKISSGLGLLHTEIEGSVGKIEGSAKAYGIIGRDGEFAPSIGAEVKAAVKGVTVGQKTAFGTDDFNIHNEQEITGGYAEAKAGISVGEDGINATAKAGAYAVNAKAKTGFTLWGIKVDLEGDYNAGGASIGGEFNVSDKEIALGGEFGLIAGLGLKIKISRK